MKKSRFTDSQIIDALKRAQAGLTVPELCREFGISSATFYKWRAKFGGMDASLMARMKELEQENQRLRKMYVEEKLKAEIVSEALAKSGEAISPTRDGSSSSSAARCVDQDRLPGVSDQPSLLSIRGSPQH